MNQLDWQSFRYVSGELEGKELEQFELQLASCQQTREAVAEAVLLCDTLAACQGLADVARVAQAEKAQPTWSRGIWMALGAALSIACLLAGSWIASLFSTPAEIPIASNEPSHDISRLAIAWTEARASLEADNADWDAGDAEASELASDDEFDTGAEHGDDTPHISAPSWMIAALAPKGMPPMDGETNDSDASEPMQD